MSFTSNFTYVNVNFQKMVNMQESLELLVAIRQSQYRGASPQRLGHMRKICALKAVLGKQHPRPERGLIHMCQSQIYHLSGDERAWSSNGGLAEAQS